MIAAARPRRLVPEVVQTSAMDCGPAALKAALEGHGIPVSYGRLREACQTDVDGTSVDDVEEVAKLLGLEADQVMVPVDHILLEEAGLLPALVVTRTPAGATHFVLAWSTAFGWVQVMDPASGRRWATKTAFTRDLYLHEHTAPADEWLAWAVSEEHLRPLRALIRRLGVDARETSRLVAGATQAGHWRHVAALDAAVRMVGALVRARGVRRGQEAAAMLTAVLERELGGASPARTVPQEFWSVAAAPQDGGRAMLVLRGAVLVRFRPREGVDAGAELLPERLRAAVEQQAVTPWQYLRNLLGEGSRFGWCGAAVGMAAAAGAVVVEAVVLLGLLDLGRVLSCPWQRAVALGATAAVVLATAALTMPTTAVLLRLGRRLEGRLYVSFLTKVPRLGDRYFRSRLVADMAERAHALSGVRRLPLVAGQLWHLTCLTVATTAGIVWLDPSGAPVAVVACALSVGLPLASQRLLVEHDLRVRTHTGALTRFLLDSLLGLAAVRCHRGEQAVQAEHEKLLVDWARASLEHVRVAAFVEGAVSACGFAAAAWLLASHVERGGEAALGLLLVYWVLSLPALGQEMAVAARQVPPLRNTLLRLLEPLSAPDEEHGEPGQVPQESRPLGVRLSLEGVSVRSSGRTLLARVDLELEEGSHVAVVGPCGAGKSSLVGLLLGWLRPAEGAVRVDGRPLVGEALAELRRATAWVDPSVQLWNRSFVDNLSYGNDGGSDEGLSSVLEQADLYPVLEALPEGLHSRLGEGGGAVSGGEGQRVRLGRALNRSGVRLVILDEAFRGLDREQRRTLLARTRERFVHATLVYVTHDIHETLGFDRVVVMEDGRVVEEGTGARLSSTPGSRYRQLLDAEDRLDAGLWGEPSWRHLEVTSGVVSESPR